MVLYYFKRLTNEELKRKKTIKKKKISDSEIEIIKNLREKNNKITQKNAIIYLKKIIILVYLWLQQYSKIIYMINIR